MINWRLSFEFLAPSLVLVTLGAGATLWFLGPNSQPGCDRLGKIRCVRLCGRDHFHAPICQNGEWTCPEATVPVSSCRDDTRRDSPEAPIPETTKK